MSQAETPDLKQTWTGLLEDTKHKHKVSRDALKREVSEDMIVLMHVHEYLKLHTTMDKVVHVLVYTITHMYVCAGMLNAVFSNYSCIVKCV